jgi:thiol-disulfide isomerase/thioredoxin
MTRLLVLIAVFLLASMSLSGAQESGFVFHQSPQPLPALTFADDSGALHSLRDFSGKTILLNIWATWCLPCREEMPTLDRLQAALGDDRFQVVALSIDAAGIEAVKTFFADINIRNLTIYIDPTTKSAADFGAVGLPTTLLIDRHGQELGRRVGPAAWDSPDMRDLLKKFISAESGNPNGGNDSGGTDQYQGSGD